VLAIEAEHVRGPGARNVFKKGYVGWVSFPRVELVEDVFLLHHVFERRVEIACLVVLGAHVGYQGLCPNCSEAWPLAGVADHLLLAIQRRPNPAERGTVSAAVLAKDVAIRGREITERYLNIDFRPVACVGPFTSYG
jgi:hypothetical protein